MTHRYRNKKQLKADAIVLLSIIAIILIFVFVSVVVPKIIVFINTNWWIIPIGILIIFTILVVLIKRWLNRRSKVSKVMSEDNLTERRTPIPTNIRLAIWKRGNNHCQIVLESGYTCSEAQRLEIHHIDKINHNHSINNLILVCPNHHSAADDDAWPKYILQEWANGNY